MRIHSNISLSSGNQLARTSQMISRSLERLSSGKRVNSPRDDVAAFSAGVRLDSQVRGLTQANLNINQAQGVIQVAQSAMQNQLDILQQMRELALEASNGTLSSSQRDNLNSVLQQLMSEFKRITNETDFNGIHLLDGSFGKRNLQIGASTATTATSLELPDLSASRKFLEAHGTGNFASAKTSSAATNVSESKLQDMNGDGKLDLITTDTSASVVSIRLGVGNGQFGTRKTFSVGSGPTKFSIADFNGDQKLDIVTSNQTASSISVLIGNGDGTFQTQRTTSISDATDVETGDFNNDGKMDILVLDRIDALTYTLLGNGDGTFQAGLDQGLDTGSYALAVGDLNRDGILDMVVGDSSGGIEHFFGNGDGSFSYQGNDNISGDAITDVQLGDINHDGNLDVLAWVQGNDQNSILLGSSSGAISYAAGVDGIGVMRLVDLNNDGFLDIMANYPTLNFGNLNLVSYNTLPFTSSSDSLAVGDIDGDGVVDAVFTSISGVSSAYLQLSTQKSALGDFNLSSSSQSQRVLSILDKTIESLRTDQASLTATHSRLDYAADGNLLLSDSLSEAKDKSLNVDVALEVADLVKNQILASAASAVLAQANLSMNLVIQLLKSGGLGSFKT